MYVSLVEHLVSLQLLRLHVDRPLLSRVDPSLHREACVLQLVLSKLPSCKSHSCSSACCVDMHHEHLHRGQAAREGEGREHAKESALPVLVPCTCVQNKRKIFLLHAGGDFLSHIRVILADDRHRRETQTQM